MRSGSDHGTALLPWPVRSMLAGAAGTAAMTLAYALERRVRHGATQLDYDDTLVPREIVGRILRLHDVSDREEAELGLALRWGYGSAFGWWDGILRRRLPEPWASLVFGATLMSATLTLFPALGRTPPPWRWTADVLATSLGTHAVYVLAVAAVDHLLGTATGRQQVGSTPRGGGSVGRRTVDVEVDAELSRLTDTHGLERRRPAGRDGRAEVRQRGGWTHGPSGTGRS